MDMKYKVTYLPLADKDISRICDALVNENEREVRVYRILYSKMDAPKHI
jgi:plasmid stabilization system protein ParE